MERTDDRTARLAVLKENVTGCMACNLRGGPKLKAPVFGRGNTHARLMIVGEAPGPQENDAMQPFVGPSGKIMSALLRAAGLDESQLWITNAVACWPHKIGGTSRGRRIATDKPPPSAVAACVPRHLAEQIRLIRPAVVVSLGSVAACAVRGVPQGRAFGPMLAFAPDDAAENTPGAAAYMFSDLGGALDFTFTALAAYHPAYLARRNFKPDGDPLSHPDARSVLRTLQAARDLTTPPADGPPGKDDK